jgi:hypothetical protein
LFFDASLQHQINCSNFLHMNLKLDKKTSRIWSIYDPHEKYMRGEERPHRSEWQQIENMDVGSCISGRWLPVAVTTKLCWYILKVCSMHH